MMNEKMVRGMDVSSEKFKEVGNGSVCDRCVMGQHLRKAFPKSELRAKQCLEFIHMNLCGPMSVDSHCGSRTWQPSWTITLNYQK